MVVASFRGHLGSAAKMGGGLVAIGLAGYAFLAITGHVLPAADAAAVASFYLIANMTGAGVFTGLEQEISRSTSAWLAGGGRLGVVARRSVAVALGLTAAVLIVLAAVSPVLTDQALFGRWGLFVAILVGVAGMSVLYLLRGLLGGMQQFTGYSVTLATEGLSRIVLCVLIVAALGTAGSTVYALAFAAGAWFAALAGLPWLRRGAGAPALPDPAGSGPPGESVTTMVRGLGLLVAATFGFQAVANLAPILVTGRLQDEPATAAAFATAFVLVRIPVLLFSAVTAMLLPALTRAVTTGNLPAMRAALRKIMIVLAGLGIPTVVVATVLGPWAVQFLFGAKVRLPHSVLGLLAVSTVLLVVTQVLLPALVALSKHRTVLLAWVAGGAVLVIMLLGMSNPVGAAVWAQLAACGLAAGIMAAGLAKPLREQKTPKAAPVAGPRDPEKSLR